MDLPSTLTLAETARLAAEAGGERLLAMRENYGVREKGAFDYVTDADVASEQAIRQVINQRHPTHRFIGEESPDKQRPAAEEVCWIVDPLDGTTNYVHQFPCYSVSVAVARGAQLLAATVYDPHHGVNYWAALGEGAWHNEQPMRVSGATRLEQSLVAMSLPPQVSPDSPDLLDFGNVVGRCQAIRRIGSAALNLAFLAAGRIDAYWARHINAWDVAAGVLLIEEAGGKVTSSTGGVFDLWKADLAAAATPDLHHELQDVLQKTRF